MSSADDLTRMMRLIVKTDAPIGHRDRTIILEGGNYEQTCEQLEKLGYITKHPTSHNQCGFEARATIRGMVFLGLTDIEIRKAIEQ